MLPEGVSLRLLILPWVGRAIQIPSHPLRLHIALELAMGWAEPSAGRLVFLSRFDRVVGFEPVTSHMRGERPNHSATSVPCPLAGCRAENYCLDGLAAAFGVAGWLLIAARFCWWE